jgi:hypothetical protein
MQALRACAARASARPSGLQGMPAAAAPAAPLRAAALRRGAHSPRGSAASAVPPRRAATASSTAEAPLLPIIEPVAPLRPEAPGEPAAAAELRRSNAQQDVARLRLEAHWAAAPAGRDFADVGDIGSVQRAAIPRAADDDDEADDDGEAGSTVRRAPLNVRGQRLLASRTLAQQRALSLSRATSRRACFESRRPVQRLHPVRPHAAPYRAPPR